MMGNSERKLATAVGQAGSELGGGGWVGSNKPDEEEEEEERGERLMKGMMGEISGLICTTRWERLVWTDGST